ncbi:hypothetical protein [Streptomyces sp. NBC_01207]|uniref:hypothetical protein n=1 Tax=Streptomyces sp. NBC_01207 TaxID=2903772 RepID=UPI002E152370|nr:hypothetical protein OG457_45960 [Streptomyces sp. NBC_01207]
MFGVALRRCDDHDPITAIAIAIAKRIGLGGCTLYRTLARTTEPLRPPLLTHVMSPGTDTPASDNGPDPRPPR